MVKSRSKTTEATRLAEKPQPNLGLVLKFVNRVTGKCRLTPKAHKLVKMVDNIDRGKIVRSPDMEFRFIPRAADHDITDGEQDSTFEQGLDRAWEDSHRRAMEIDA